MLFKVSDASAVRGELCLSKLYQNERRHQENWKTGDRHRQKTNEICKMTVNGDSMRMTPAAISD